MAIKLYEFAPTRSIRARWTLQELGVDFEAISVNMLAGEHKSPAFLKVNPAGKLPVLVDGNLTLNESVAIVLYLGEKFPEKNLVPKDPSRRAEVYKWLMFAATELEQPLWRIVRNLSFYPEEKRIAQDVERAREDFAPMARIAEDHMRGRHFVVGDSVTIADFVMAYTLDWANEAELLGDFANLTRYMNEMYARPYAAPRIAAAFASVGGNVPGR